MKWSILPILLRMLVYSACGVVVWLVGIDWMIVVGVLGVVFLYYMVGYIFIWRSNVTALHLAIDNQGKLETLEETINNNLAKMDATSVISQRVRKDYEVIALIKEGADIGAKDKEGNTPLHIAGRCNRDVIALALICKGADVDAKNNAGNTPLHWAAVFNAKKVAKVLISAGADVNSENKHGLTPLDIAEANNYRDLTQIFVEGMSKDITEEDIKDIIEENHEYP